MAVTKGNFTYGGAITTDTPVYEWDTETTADTTYLRYENTTEEQYIERATTKLEACVDEWANRATTSKWRPISQGR